MSPGPPSPGRDSAPGRILVVDDDPEMARMVAEALQADGHAVEFETEWKRAVDQAVLGGHELVITDVRMGERSPGRPRTGSERSSTGVGDALRPRKQTSSAVLARGGMVAVRTDVK